VKEACGRGQKAVVKESDFPPLVAGGGIVKQVVAISYSSKVSGIPDDPERAERAERARKEEAALETERKRLAWEKERRERHEKKEAEHAEKMYEKYGNGWIYRVTQTEDWDFVARRRDEEENEQYQETLEMDREIDEKIKAREERRNKMTWDEIRAEDDEEEEEYMATCLTAEYYSQVR